MENRKAKTALMLKNKVAWGEIEKTLSITKPTLMSWRKSGDPNKNQVIDEAIQEIVNKR